VISVTAFIRLHATSGDYTALFVLTLQIRGAPGPYFRRFRTEWIQFAGKLHAARVADTVK